MTPHVTFSVTNPATGQHLEEVADLTAEQALTQVERAQQTFAQWRDTPPRQRAEVLHRAYALMIEDLPRLRDLIVAENGKSQADAESEVRYAAEFFRWYAEEAVRLSGEYTTAPAGGVRNIVTHHPVGVALLITPWNFPAAMATRKIGPALAAGCTVVLKPARETPLTALAIAEVLVQAGLPEGAVQVATTTATREVVTALLADDRIKKLSFTGSTPVGRTLLAQCAERVVNASMELGGNAPFIITADADIEAAVQGAMVAKFRNGGQACTAANRFYVHADVGEEFIAAFGAQISRLTVGDPAQGTQIGPLIHGEAASGVRQLIQSALDDGATVAHQATLPESAATEAFVAPTLLRDVPAGAAILREEIFGPVAPVVVWSDLEQMLQQANAAEVGLSSYVYSGTLQEAIRIAERLETGMVGINRGVVSDPSAPFGGVKQAGIGREGGHWGIEEFTEPQYLSVDWP
ncbi:NAD-dependent succinate-semialdehyde dehydrogenase [Nesterenkonia sphaerica]|uniref:NAD-dependent succinate-semialdehyde dehydrogenase n=2 Tax=Nesterenkonia sphaerica TaxID=1804988 RepID=A0A5R9AMT4_9MICC|nr:NAD-dependent succinate-semialdehyde dehydrogenase [Nesterenkonia sphaerica]